MKYKAGYQCSFCKSHKIVGRELASGLSGFKCNNCGDVNPYKINDIEDAAEGKSKHMTVKEAVALLDSNRILEIPDSANMTADDLALNSVGGLSPNDVSEALSSFEKRPFKKLGVIEFEEIVVALDLLSEHSAATPYLRELMIELYKEVKRRVPIP